MKHYFLQILFLVLFPFLLFAQKPDRTSIDLRMEQLKADITNTVKKHHAIKEERRNLSLSYKTEEDINLYDAVKLSFKYRLKENRNQYIQLIDQKKALLGELENYETAMKKYHRSQDYIKYKRKANWNKGVAVGLAAGGGTFTCINLIGLISEPVHVTTEEERIRLQRQKNLYLIGFLSGAAIANSSIYFFIKSRQNKKTFLEHISFDINIQSLPNNYANQAVMYPNLNFRLRL